jgi:hypothetical protein
VLLPDLPGVTTTAEVVFFHNPGVYPANVPAGSRLSARWQTDGSSNNDLTVILIGVPA